VRPVSIFSKCVIKILKNNEEDDIIANCKGYHR